MGIKLLNADNWGRQYSLSLNLYEMSAKLSFMSGDIGTMSTSIDTILSHATSFNDSLNASAMLVKLLSSRSQYKEAIINCLGILSHLGEDFPPSADKTVVLNELSTIYPLLTNISKEQFTALEPMTDVTKLHAMKFLSMLCRASLVSAPIFMPLVCVRMINLTMKHGFCDDSIIGLVMTGSSLVSLVKSLMNLQN